MSGQFTKEYLAELQGYPLFVKLSLTKQRIREWVNKFGEDGVYVSFSGGKDSTVLKHIVDSMFDDVPAVFVNTGLEYPEIQNFVRDVKSGKYDCFNTDVEILRPEIRFDEVIKEYGYPVISKEISERIYYAKKGSEWAIRCLNGENPDGSKSVFKQRSKKYAFLVDSPFPVSHKCCTVMKKNPAKRYEKETGRKPILATMACESYLRKTQWTKVGCNAFEGIRPRSAPMSFWTEQDVLLYIYQNQIPIASVYGEVIKENEVDGQLDFADIGLFDLGRPILKTTGCNRTGCMFCGYGCHLEPEGEGRFERLKITHPKIYDYIMRPLEDGGLNYKEVIDWINERGNLHIRY